MGITWTENELPAKLGWLAEIYDNNTDSIDTILKLSIWFVPEYSFSEKYIPLTINGKVVKNVNIKIPALTDTLNTYDSRNETLVYYEEIVIPKDYKSQTKSFNIQLGPSKTLKGKILEITTSSFEINSLIFLSIVDLQ